MPFIPHSEHEIQEMLEAIGVTSIEDLFDEIPTIVRPKKPLNIAEGISEKTLTQFLTRRALKDQTTLSFLGAGAYEHFIPATVWALASRGEFMTAYTPYQPEASQGSLQLIYEYQSMMTELMQLDMSNASLYDGATALSEAILMAIRSNKNKASRHVLVVGPLSPFVIETVESITKHQGVQLEQVNADSFQDQLFEQKDYVAVVIGQPNFLGQIIEVDHLTNLAHAHQALVIAYVHPLAMSLIKPPGLFGEKGADIACGEGQPLGIPLSFGGPYFGFLCCKLEYVRQMPGRIVGKTEDSERKESFCLTLQAREQHIRRAKATSNICTNQGLMVTAATIYMTLLGSQGLYQVAKACHDNTENLIEKLCKVPGVSLAAPGPFYCEFPIQLPVNATDFLDAMAERGIQAGYPLDLSPSQMSSVILITTTEVHDTQDLEEYVQAFKNVLNQMHKGG